MRRRLQAYGIPFILLAMLSNKGDSMINKVMSLQSAAAMISDGDLLAIGGNVLHRAPMALIREIIRQGKKNLRLIKTTGAHDVDALCYGQCVASVDAGFIGYESEFGLAVHYRRAVEAGKVKGNEHSCYTVMSALRAAAYGAPFLPVAGLKNSDLVRYNDYFKVIDDPFGSGPIALVQALKPRFALIHVQECDPRGNARISGPMYDDILMANAADQIILTAEEVVPELKLKMNVETVDIPYFLVSAVVHAPGGAMPCSCYKKYDADAVAIRKFKEAKSGDDLQQYLKSYEVRDRMGKAGGIR